MAQFHFVEDYVKLVDVLCSAHPLDEAMSLAVGGDYHRIGQIERDILRYAGLKDGMSLIDIGCGSGRLASALSASGMEINYLGTDIVQKLLDYAASKSKADYSFKLHRELSIPAADASADMICLFSVFTHLLPHESYIYMEDIRRTLRPGGKLIFSFLEISEPSHWQIFESTVEAQRRSVAPHLNMFIERDAIRVWAQKLGFSEPKFLGARDAVPGSSPLGQATAFLTRL